MLCQGCGHPDMFHALNEVMAPYPNHRVFGDIGCYTLGALPPFNAIHTCVDMGAAITMAKGAADAGMHPAVCVIGDSTFTHSGITGLLDAVNDRSPLTVIISDNETTAMTGGTGFGRNGALPRYLPGNRRCGGAYTHAGAAEAQPRGERAGVAGGAGIQRGLGHHRATGVRADGEKEKKKSVTIKNVRAKVNARK